MIARSPEAEVATAGAPMASRTATATREPGSRRRRALYIALEILIAVALSLLFFGLFLLLLSAIFPQGTGFRDLIRSEPRATPEAGTATTTAVLTAVDGEVRSKRASEIAWNPASTGTSLRGGDGVQTYSRGNAVVKFDEWNQMKLGRNTLIVMKEQREMNETGRRRSTVTLMHGELSVDLSDRQQKAVELRIDAGGARIRVPSGENASKAHIKVSMDAGLPTLAVFGGAAQLESQGRTVEVRAHQVATLSADGVVEIRDVAMPAPALQSPRSHARLRVRPDAPGLPFAWRPVEEAASYRIVVARDASFREVVADGQTARTSFTSPPLPAGTYYWRVSAAGVGHEPGTSPAQSFELIPSTGPALQVALPPPIVHHATYTLTGSTVPGATVRAGGHQVVADESGQFTCEVSLVAGVNVVVVESIDALGNTSYASTVVNAKLPGR